MATMRHVMRAFCWLIARAHCWFDDLLSGRSASTVEIGKREAVGNRYVSRIIPLAFLAPQIVEQIINGCQPPEVTAESLLRDRLPVPLSWESQQKALRFSLHCLTFRLGEIHLPIAFATESRLPR
jgi:hypothetical protein